MPATDQYELQALSNMDRIKNLFRGRPSYEPIHDGTHRDDEDAHDGSEYGEAGPPFSWVEYSIFLLLGVAMLWAW